MPIYYYRAAIISLHWRRTRMVASAFIALSSLFCHSLLVTGLMTNGALGHHGYLSFRAYLPPTNSNFRPLLLEQIEKLPNHSFSKIQDRYIEFALATSPDAHHLSPSSICSLHTLPATKVTILLPLRFSKEHGATTLIFRNPESEHEDDADVSITNNGIGEKMESLLETWSALGGNRRPVSDDSLTSFSVTPVLPSSTSNRRRKKRLEKGGGSSSALPTNTNTSSRSEASHVAAALRTQLASHFGWVPSAMMSSNNADLAFQLSHDDDDDDDDDKETTTITTTTTTTTTNDPWNLELLVLARVFPLPTKNQRRTSSRSKRLESFVVAKTANIQPNDIVLDPRCQRGTILIEAAKYWPLASKFIGVDSDIGHLEHARMNADSTLTGLELRHVVAPNVHHYLPIEASSVDKIVSCMPFGKSMEHYTSLLKAWAILLKPGGQMTLVVDQRSLDSLTEGIRRMPSSELNMLLFLSFVRKPSIEWGNERATIVQVLKATNRGGDGQPTTHHGIMEWERGKPEHQSFSDFWASTRLKHIPSLIHSDRAQRAGQTNYIVLSNQKVYR